MRRQDRGTTLRRAQFGFLRKVLLFRRKGAQDEDPQDARFSRDGAQDQLLPVQHAVKQSRECAVQSDASTSMI